MRSGVACRAGRRRHRRRLASSAEASSVRPAEARRPRRRRSARRRPRPALPPAALRKPSAWKAKCPAIQATEEGAPAAVPSGAPIARASDVLAPAGERDRLGADRVEQPACRPPSHHTNWRAAEEEQRLKARSGVASISATARPVSAGATGSIASWSTPATRSAAAARAPERDPGPARSARRRRRTAARRWEHLRQHLRLTGWA